MTSEYIKVSGGIFLDQTIHDFDMARFLLDSEIEEVYALGGAMVDPAIGAAGDIDTAILAEMKAFVDCIVHDTPPPVTGLDGRIPVIMGLAAWKSYRENRPVKLSEIP